MFQDLRLALPLATAVPVSADFFAVMGIPIRSGAVFSADLRADARPMVVVNETLARRFWPGQDAVGKRLRMKDRDELAEIIGVVGLYGVIEHLTAQRTRDIGVRIALGADYRAIVSMILRQGSVLFALGMVLGLPSYIAVQMLLVRTMPEMPFPGYWLGAVILTILGLATLAASFLPAHRAARVDPIVALRADWTETNGLKLKVEVEAQTTEPSHPIRLQLILTT